MMIKDIEQTLPLPECEFLKIPDDNIIVCFSNASCEK